MPWKDTMNERVRFVTLHAEGCYSMTELCQRFDISRNTGYKWLARFTEGGYDALADQSRAPHSCPHRTPPEVEAALVRAREAHPHWGPKKLLPHLRRYQPQLSLPARSTAGEVLKR
jgi:putative transposase